MHSEQALETPDAQAQLDVARRENHVARQEIHRLENEVRLLREMLALERNRRFGPSSEKTAPEQQRGLFNEAEATADAAEPEPEPEDEPQTERAVCRARRPRTIDLSRLPQEDVIYALPEEEQVCPQCSGPLHEMSQEVRPEIKVIPARMVVVRHVRIKYACRHCQQHGISTPIITASMPQPAFPASLASASAVAHVVGQKFLEAAPLYRQEKSWQRAGVEISRQTLANWVIKGADWLAPLYDRMRERLLRSDIVKADETPVQVLHEDGRKAQTKSFMWLYRSGRDGPPIVLFEYRIARSGEHPKTFLNGFSGYLQTDGYAGYGGVPGVVGVGCWAHARRKFDEALSVLSNADRREGAAIAHVGPDYCNRLFAIEREPDDAAPEEHRWARLEQSKPLLDEFHAWLMTRSAEVLPKSPSGTAVGYCLKQ
jgi:transposase